MEGLQVFTNDSFGKIRVVEVDGKPWFVGKDVAECLGYNNTRDALSKHVDDEDKDVAKCDTLGGKQDLAVINESGVYSLIMGSKLHSAKAFKRWVTSEVLPSIHKHGAYITAQTAEQMLLDPDFLVELVTRFRDVTKEKLALEAQLAEQAPLVEFADAIIRSEDNLDIGTFAKVIKKQDIDIGQNKLYKFMRDNKILMRNNIPYQKYIDSGQFMVRESVYEVKHVMRINKQTLITPTGQMWFINKFYEQLKTI